METVAFILLGFFVGGVIGWLWAGRESAGAKQTVETLRRQLDEVVKEPLACALSSTLATQA